MHRLPSKSSIFRFRISSLLLWMSVVSLLAGLVVAGIGLFASDELDVLSGTMIIGGGIVAYLMEWMLSRRARCPLCMTPPLHPSGCQKNRRAKRLFGSHRLQIATCVLFRDYFQCSYCGESTKVEVRRRPEARED